MTNLIIINIITLILIFIAKLGVFFALSKRLNQKAEFSNVFKAFLIYEILTFLFVLIYLGMSNFLFVETSILHILLFIIVSYIIFLVAIYFTKLFSWKKGLLVFALMFFIITPLVSGIVSGSISMIARPSFKEVPLDLLSNLPLSLKIIDRINQSLAGGLISRYYFSIILSL